MTREPCGGVASPQTDTPPDILAYGTDPGSPRDVGAGPEDGGVTAEDGDVGGAGQTNGGEEAEVGEEDCADGDAQTDGELRRQEEEQMEERAQSDGGGTDPDQEQDGALDGQNQDTETDTQGLREDRKSVV